MLKLTKCLSFLQIILNYKYRNASDCDKILIFYLWYQSDYSLYKLKIEIPKLPIITLHQGYFSGQFYWQQVIISEICPFYITLRIPSKFPGYSLCSGLRLVIVSVADACGLQRYCCIHYIITAHRFIAG